MDKNIQAQQILTRTNILVNKMEQDIKVCIAKLAKADWQIIPTDKKTKYLNMVFMVIEMKRGVPVAQDIKMHLFKKLIQKESN
jgi:hypothetical protein